MGETKLEKLMILLDKLDDNKIETLLDKLDSKKSIANEDKRIPNSKRRSENDDSIEAVSKKIRLGKRPNLFMERFADNPRFKFEKDKKIDKLLRMPKEESNDIIDIGIKSGIIKKSGSWYTINNNKIQGKKNLNKYLKDNPEVKKEISNASE